MRVLMAAGDCGNIVTVLAMKRLSRHDVGPELRWPEIQPTFVAFLGLMAGRTRFAAELSRRGYGSIDLRDVVIIMHVTAYMDHGTRQQHLIDTLELPRRTIRGKLDRLERVGILVREGARYYPAPIIGEVAAAEMEATMREISRLSDAWVAYRNAIRRDAPK